MCELYAGDMEICQVWNEYPRRARKQHRCSRCSAPILAGEHYLYHLSILDGSPDRERMCFLCWWAREDFHQEHGGPMPMPSALEEFLQECVLGDPASEARWGPYWEALKVRAGRIKEED